ncbi:hypothetical protein ASE01_11890 [Nocardioides sp. Root190]|uniref:hypothetical protein n=1 Tax=Nocardioides sp. Root190 TaxID=1736488 RepID=UPI0006F5639D|nr:hypothetical protein [Nocardioides sp. Root190]KRB77408.1 hypothetical protein ASE01_11890 [Nocardioides sp. Root190]
MSEYDARLTDRVRTRGVLGPDDAARLLLPVAESLASIHTVSGSHGAVSPSAVQVDPAGHALLLDRTSVPPDPSFVAPDPSVGLRPHPAAADVWSFAAVLLFVTTGHVPRPGVPPTVADVAPRDIGWLAPLVELALVVDPRERPTMADVVAYLRARVPAPPAPPRSKGMLLTVAGAALIVGLGLVGAVLLFTGTDDPDDRPAARNSSSGPTSEESSATEEPGEPEDGPTETEGSVTADELEEFARDYVTTASRDPDRGYARLTPEYQSASPRYREVWGAISDPQILSVTPDPDALSVSYTYRYSLPGGSRRTEAITLRLVEEDGLLLIAGASAR